MSCRRPSNRSSRLALPWGPLNSYSFSTASHGIRRRSAASASRVWVNSFSLTSSCWRAASHSSGDTTFGTFMPLFLFMSFSLFVSFFLFLIFLPQSTLATALLCLRRILFKLLQRGIHVIPRVRVRYPHIHLRVEPARIVQARGSDRDKLRNRVGIAHNRRAAVGTKPPMGLATGFTLGGMEAQRALQELESFLWHDDER